MHANNFCRIGIFVLTLITVLPAVADTQFRVRKMMRNDVPPGKGQCDIRLQVDQEAEVSVRGDMVSIRTLAGRDPRDDGSECNEPLPANDLQGFNYEVKESRNDIQLVAEPSRRNGFSAVVHIRDSAGGEGRYHFRLSWLIGGGAPPMQQRPPERQREPDVIPRGPERRGGFVWDDVITFRGEGRGTVTFDRNPIRIFGVNIDIDRRGKLVAVFRMEGGRTLSFSGTVIGRERDRIQADVVSDDRMRVHGPMYVSVDGRRDVNSVNLEADNGRDRMRLNWDRR